MGVRRLGYLPLLNGYLDQIIDEQDYRAQKVKLLSEKKSLQEEISSLSRNAHDWLAPLLDWLKDASDLDKIASDTDLFAKKVWAKEIFGSHLRLGGKVVTVAASVAPQNGAVATPTQWAARSAAHASVGFEPTSSILVPRRGLEPPRLAALVPHTSVYTNFTTWASYREWYSTRRFL